MSEQRASKMEIVAFVLLRFVLNVPKTERKEHRYWSEVPAPRL